MKGNESYETSRASHLSRIPKEAQITSDLGFLSNQPMCRRSGIARDASWRAAVVRTAKAECSVLNQATASPGSLALNTQLCIASGLCNSSVLPSEIKGRTK